MPKPTRKRIIEKLRLDRDFSGQDLSGLDLTGIILSGVDLSMANLTRCDFNGVDLSKANLSEAILIEAILTNAKLSEANLTWAKLNHTNLSESELHGASLIGATLSQADLYRAVLVEVNLSLANLSEANLTEVNLAKSNLNKTNFTKANLSGTDLRDAEFKNANLSGADLSGADLRRCKLISVDLTGAKLTGAKLHKAWFSNTKLNNIICEWADFSPLGDGSDIHRPGDPVFERMARIRRPRIIFTSNTEIDTTLLGGLMSLVNTIQPLNAKLSKVEEISSGVSSITFEVAAEKNPLPAVIVLFNALVRSAKIDFEALTHEMSKFDEPAINDIPLTELLKASPELIATFEPHNRLLEKFRAGFSSMTADIQGETVSIKRQEEQLHIDYRQAKVAAKATICSMAAKTLAWILRH